MKTRTRHFIQNLSHEIEDEEKAESYLVESLPLVGLVVMYFNTLEKSLDAFLCEIISHRAEAPGLIVIQKLMYAAKLDLFKRFADDFHLCEPTKPPKFDELIAELGDVARLRNLVVHADWSSTDEKGYTYVRLKSTKNGLQQEYAQLSVESLDGLVNRVIAATHSLSDYWEWRSECLASHYRANISPHK